MIPLGPQSRTDYKLCGTCMVKSVQSYSSHYVTFTALDAYSTVSYQANVR